MKGPGPEHYTITLNEFYSSEAGSMQWYTKLVPRYEFGKSIQFVSFFLRLKSPKIQEAWNLTIQRDVMAFNQQYNNIMI